MMKVKNLVVLQNCIFTFLSLHIIDFYKPHLQVIKKLFLICLNKTHNVMKELKESDCPKQVQLPNVYLNLLVETINFKSKLTLL